MSGTAGALDRARVLLASIPITPRSTADLAAWELALLFVRVRLSGAIDPAARLPVPLLRVCAARLEEAAVLAAPSSLDVAATLVEASVVLWLAIPDVMRGTETADRLLALAPEAPDQHRRVLRLLGVTSLAGLRALRCGARL